MTKVYELVLLGMERQGIKTDNAFAVKNGLSRSHINNWKMSISRRPDIDNLRILADAAGMSMDDAYEFLRQEQHQEAGYANVGLLAVTGLISAGGMSLLAGTPTIEAIAGAAVGGAILANIHYAKY